MESEERIDELGSEKDYLIAENRHHLLPAVYIAYNKELDHRDGLEFLLRHYKNLLAKTVKSV
jgi:hypothetical protein